MGYVVRDVESMIRDFTEMAVEMTKQNAFKKVKTRAAQNVEERILDILLPPSKSFTTSSFRNENLTSTNEKFNKTRLKLRDQLKNNELDEKLIEFESQGKSNDGIDFIGTPGIKEMGASFRGMLGNLFPTKTVNRKMKVSAAKISRSEINKKN